MADVECVDEDETRAPNQPKSVLYFGTCTWCGQQAPIHENGAEGVHRCRVFRHVAVVDYWKRPRREVWGPLDTNVARIRRKQKRAAELPESDAALQTEFEQLERKLIRLTARFERVRAEIERRRDEAR